MNTAPAQSRASDSSFLQRHPVTAYFGLTFALSWAGALLVALPSVTRWTEVPKITGALMFPAMLIGPSASGLVLTRLIRGRSAFKDLLSRMRRVRVAARWYITLVIPPLLILSVLYCLTILRGNAFAPNRFYVGAAFGVVAGFFEEIGWMGFAFPQLRAARSAIGSAIILGALWSLWHLPVINYLGTATPHGEYWLRYFLAFAAVMIPVRVLIAWLYTNTESVVVCQLMHASSTGSLVVLSPAHVSTPQEACWYFVYAGTLWILVAVLAATYGRNLTRIVRG